MKKMIVLVFLALFLTSCGHATKSEFFQHDSMYKNWDHIKFSWFGNDNPTAKDVEESQDQNWWGIEVPYVPGQ